MAKKKARLKQGPVKATANTPGFVDPYPRGVPSKKKLPAFGGNTSAALGAAASLPYDPRIAGAIAGFGEARDTGAAAIMGEQRAGFDALGIVRDANGAPVYDAQGNFQLNTQDVSSRAGMIQRQWENARNASYQGAGRNLYSGSYQNTLAANARGELEDKAKLFADARSLLAGFESRRAEGVADYQTNVGNTIGQFATALAESPNEHTPTGTVPKPRPKAKVTAPKKPYTSKRGKDSKGRPGSWHTYPDGQKVFVRD